MAKKTNNLRELSEKQISQKFPKSGKASIIALSPENTLRIPTRNIALNHQLNGGLPYGKYLELFGEESTGKSLLASDFGYCCQALGGEIIWADVENSFNAHWAQVNGIDLDRVHLMTETSGMEIVSDWIQYTVIAIRKRLTKNQPILVVLDSIGAVRCAAEVGESQMDASAKYGNRAKAISDFLGNRSEMFARMGVAVILINQLRKKIGASKFEDPDKTVGGDALKFYASQRLNLIRGKQILKKVRGIEIKVGQNVYIKTKKDKTGPPRSTTPAQVYFTKTKTNGIGFDKYVSLPDLLVFRGVVERKKGSSMYYYKGKMIARGEESFLELINANADTRSSLIAESKINTIGRTKKQLESIKINMFQVSEKKQKSEE